MTNETIDLSIILLNQNRKDLLRNCLESIRTHSRSFTYEIIVVDISSQDGSQEMLIKDFPDVILINYPKPFSFTKANNAGYRKSSGRNLLFLNNDTLFANNAGLEIIQYLDNHPECGVVGCKLLNQDGSIQYSCRTFPNYSTALFNRYSFLTQYLPGNPFSTNYLMKDFNHDSTGEVDWVSGACLAIRRKIFEDIGLFDEGICYFAEDVDLCYRVRLGGYKVIFLHSGEVIHLIGATRSNHPYRSCFNHHRSMLYFYNKHYNREILLINLLVGASIVLRGLIKMTEQLFLGNKRIKR